VIVRDPELEALVNEGIERGRLSLEETTEDRIKESQSGLIHHVRDELPYRIKMQKGWTPIKRVKPSSKFPKWRKEVQKIRYKIATNSHIEYQEALRRGDW